MWPQLISSCFLYIRRCFPAQMLRLLAHTVHNRSSTYILKEQWTICLFPELPSETNSSKTSHDGACLRLTPENKLVVIFNDAPPFSGRLTLWIINATGWCTLLISMGKESQNHITSWGMCLLNKKTVNNVFSPGLQMAVLLAWTC